MALHYLDRTTYRARHTPALLLKLQNQFGRCYLLPEGGSNGLAVRGVADLIGPDWPAADWVVCPVGTGGTLAGLAAGLAGRPTRVLGIAVLKEAAFLHAEVDRLLAEAAVAQSAPWLLHLDFHAGGYAKAPPALRTFTAELTARHGLPLEPVYSGKMFWALWMLVAQGFFAPGSRLIALHTGGVDLPPAGPSASF